MSNVFTQWRDTATQWLEQMRGWLGNSQSDRPEPTSQDLPPEAERKLREAIADLPPHPSYCEAVREAIMRSLSAEGRKREDRNAAIALHSPAERFEPILRAACQHPDLSDYAIALLDTVPGRASQPAAVLTELRQTIDTPIPAAAPKVVAQTEVAKIAALEDCEIEPLEIAAIPALSACFVRCIEGMNGIESVWSTLARDTSRFWAIGCNQLAWTYLKRTTQIDSYFANLFELPALKGEDLQTWLTPVQNQLAQAMPDITVPDWEEDSDRQFYEALANAANGLATPAAYLWLSAFKVEDIVVANEDGVNADAPPRLKRNKPSRPRLPELTNNERYLIYALLLHGGMSLERLSQSLGDSASTVGSWTRRLLRSRVLVLEGDSIRVNPLYYPGLKSHLSGHNFLID